jgi:hypothetical protein
VDEWRRFQEVVVEVTGANGSRAISYQRLLFQDVDVRGRSLLDLGGGTGVVSFYACPLRSQKGRMPRTERCGVNGRCPRGFELIRSKVDVDVDFVSGRLEGWSEAFDVVLMNNVINHLDEGACQRLHLDAQAGRTYRAQLEKAARSPSRG